MNKFYSDPRFAGIEPFKSKIWLSSPTMHGEEQKWVDEAIRTNWVSTVGANINETEKLKFWLLITIFSICGAFSLYSCSSDEDAPQTTVERIKQRGSIIVGTTGDYRPLSFCEPKTGEYWGFGIEMAKEIAKQMNVEIVFVKTSWPTLTADVLASPQLFDLAIGGITITDARCETMLMSNGYLANGKTILCRSSEASRFLSLADIDHPEVRVMVNPGGLNEKFANDYLSHATIIVHQ